MAIPFSDVIMESEPIRSLSRLIANMGPPRFGSKLKEDPKVAVDTGQLKVSIRLGERKLVNHLGCINN
jgi:hypothetical protein